MYTRISKWADENVRPVTKAARTRARFLLFKKFFFNRCRFSFFPYVLYYVAHEPPPLPVHTSCAVEVCDCHTYTKRVRTYVYIYIFMYTMQNDETGVYVQVWNNNVQRTGRHTVKRQNAVRNKNRRKERANRRDDGNAAKISAVYRLVRSPPPKSV